MRATNFSRISLGDIAPSLSRFGCFVTPSLAPPLLVQDYKNVFFGVFPYLRESVTPVYQINSRAYIRAYRECGFSGGGDAIRFGVDYKVSAARLAKEERENLSS